jgi:hypothetical protein
MAKPQRRPKAVSRSARQNSHGELVDRAKRTPGVAEAIEAFGRLEPYVGGARTALPHSRGRYATGGNAR